jgi:hypothetical protein
MNRAVEIVNSLRTGMENMLKEDKTRRVNSLRLFNFDKNRVSLRMELVGQDNEIFPMGMIDVVEFPTGEKHKASCNCHMTDLSTGKSEKLILRLHNHDQKKIECAKVFNFFRKVLKLPEATDVSQPIQSENSLSPSLNQSTKEEGIAFPPTNGKIPESPRGAQS